MKWFIRIAKWIVRVPVLLCTAVLGCVIGILYFIAAAIILVIEWSFGSSEINALREVTEVFLECLQDWLRSWKI